MSELKLVPELYCDDIEITKQFYTDVLGFNIKYQRIAEQFIYFTFDGVDIMVEGINGVGRRWLTAKMEKPYGRGINLQWDVADIDSLYKRVKSVNASAIYLDLEIKQYQCGDSIASQKQFVVQDPDGYLFRFCCDA